MKKTILLIVVIVWLIWFSQAAVLDEAVTWMNENNLTIFKTVTDYKPNDYIRRDEAAKLFVKFAQLENNITYVKTPEECKFSDLNDAHLDLKDIIVESCRLWIFQWKNNKFTPKWLVSNKEILTSIVRIIEKDYDKNELSVLSTVGLQKGTDEKYLTDKATRGYTADLLYRFWGVLKRMSDVERRANLQQILAALETYKLDNNTYPVYNSYIDTKKLSGDLVSGWYLITIPVIKDTVDYYKTISKDSQENKWFILITKMSDTSQKTQANFFWDKSILENKSFEEITVLLNNPMYSTWSEAWYVLMNWNQ